MEVGQSRQEGVIKITRNADHYLVECGMCDWSKEYESEHTADWLAFTHNRNFNKEGCKPKKDTHGKCTPGGSCK